MEDTPRTPTEAIVMAMEMVEDMEEVVVAYRLAKDEKGHGGCGWVSSIKLTSSKIALLEETKMGMFADAYGLGEER